MKQSINLKDRLEWILAAGGALLALVVIWFVVWGVSLTAKNIGAAVGGPVESGRGQSFDLEGARALDFRGLEGQ